jgi:alpha-ketoglutarate-dependent taurine dioxygenase
VITRARRWPAAASEIHDPVPLALSGLSWSWPPLSTPTEQALSLPSTEARREDFTVHAVPDGTYDGITLTRRHPLIGAEIRGVDLWRVDDETFRRIYDAWLRHLLLVFPEQNLTDEEQIAFARRFGDLEIHPSREHRSSRHPEIYRVANVDEHGNIMPQDSKGWRYMNLTWLWHSDSSFREVPSMGSILHGIEVPPEGGDTLFANMYAVYEALPDAMKERVRGLRIVHSHDQVLSHDQKLRSASEDYARLPPVRHPLVRRHPVTGRLSLFLSPHTMTRVERLTDDEGRALLDQLTAFATQDRFVYRHKWRKHDVIFWDNRCTMHAVMPYDAANRRRIMHRTTIMGDGPVIPAEALDQH